MKITPELLRTLGAEATDERGDSFEWATKEHTLTFKPILGFDQWMLTVDHADSHVVYELTDCFDRLYDHAFESGKEERSKEIRELLG